MDGGAEREAGRETPAPTKAENRRGMPRKLHSCKSARSSLLKIFTLRICSVENYVQYHECEGGMSKWF